MSGLHGCVLCDEPPPHEHDLGVILNSRYYCADGGRHAWAPKRRLHAPRCSRCGGRQRREPSRLLPDWHEDGGRMRECHRRLCASCIRYRLRVRLLGGDWPRASSGTG